MRSARDKNRNQFSSFMKLARRQPEIRIRLITVSPPPHDRFVATRNASFPLISSVRGPFLGDLPFEFDATGTVLAVASIL
jgi:hypothetical protein